MIRSGVLGLLAAAVSFAQPPSKPIHVKFGEPNVWSLDQAHYLLEQRFQKNYTLEATRPGADDLNANAVNGNKLTALRTLIQAGANFDQNVGLNNQLAQRRIAEDLGLRSERTQQLQTSFEEQSRIASDIDNIAKDPANYYTKPDGTKDMNPDAKARTAALNLRLDAEKRHGDVIKASLTDSVPTQLQKVDAPEKVALGQVGFDALKDKFAFGDPKLAASNAVDNFINLQNEMIMKQVTLLRDEAGYNRRIVFAELPQSFEVEGLRWYRKASENKLIQVQWQLGGFLYVDRDKRESLLDQKEPYVRRELISATQASMKGQSPAGSKDVLSVLSETHYGCVMTPGSTTPPSPAHLKEARKLNTGQHCSQGNRVVEMPEGTLRAVELVPRQSSLNINERHYAHSAINLYGLFRLLSGFGLNVGYQRQKETYEQYITQEIYATSYGKGSSDFGWIFAPNPGTRTVAPGQRSTYAIFSAPSNAISIVLRARACVFDRRDRVDEFEDCEHDEKGNAIWQEFIVPVPSEYDSAFWVSEARYTPTLSGTRQVVYLAGTHFSNLTGVTVNGVPLRRSVSIAAPELSPAVAVQNGDGGIVGEYELLGSHQLVMAFKMPAGYTGTPMIGLITPVKARYLNDLHLDIRVGGRRYDKVFSLSHPEVFPMFYAKPELRTVRVAGSRLHVEGSGLSLLDQYSARPWVRYFWNDELVPLDRPSTVGGTRSGDPFAERIVLVIDPDKTRVGSRSDLRMEFYPDLGIPPVRLVTANPASFAISKAAIVKFIAAVEADKAQGITAVPASALLEIEGANLEPGMKVDLEYNTGDPQSVTARLTSEGKLIARIAPPKTGGFALFTVTDSSATPRKASGSVEIPAPKKEKDPDFTETERIIKQVPAPKKEK